jgi:CheY-like chemotaxis protein
MEEPAQRHSAPGCLPHPADDARRAHILVAEDHPVNRLLVMTMLKRMGYTADAVATGAEAVCALRTQHYDLVLMDCEMPELDGYGATGHIRRPETGALNPRVPIVALTANTLPGDRERCLAQGMDDYLPKPIEMSRLALVLARWIGGDAVAGPHPGPGSEPEPAGQVFNADSLLKRVAGNRRLAAKLVEGFLSDTPAQLLQLRQQLEQNDAPAARIQAHKLKGAAALLSAGALRGAAFEAEQAARAGCLDRLAELLPVLEQEFDRLRQSLTSVSWT